MTIGKWLILIYWRDRCVRIYDLTTGAKPTDAAPCPPEEVWEWRW